MRSLKELCNEANPTKLGGVLNKAQLGTLLAMIPVTRVIAVSSHIGVMPDEQKPAAILRCFATAGTTKGYKTVVEGSPSATQVAINALGNLVFNSADAVSECEVTYLPQEGEIIEEIITPATGLATLLGGRRAVQLLEGEVLAGSVPGDCTVVARGGSPSTTQCCLTNAGLVQFNNATDAPTSVRVKYIACPGEGTIPQPTATDLLTEDIGW
jgi:hypothetical protein